jgi:hypothetical protein
MPRGEQSNKVPRSSPNKNTSAVAVDEEEDLYFDISTPEAFMRKEH